MKEIYVTWRNSSIIEITDEAYSDLDQGDPDKAFAEIGDLNGYDVKIYDNVSEELFYEE